MTIVQNQERLDIILALPDEKTRRESIMNIRHTAADQDFYDIVVAIANLINDTLSDRHKAYNKQGLRCIIPRDGEYKGLRR